MSGIITGAVLAGIAATSGLIGMGKSFSDAAKQRRKASQAERDSKILMQEAKAKMQKNFYEGLTLPTEAYDRAFRGNAVQQKQAIESLQGADARTLAAGIGKVGALGMTANEAERLTMGKDLFALDLTKAENAQNINDELVGMDVGQAKDQMAMAGDLRVASAASTLSGIQSGIAGLSAAASAVPTYIKSGGDIKAGSFAQSESFKNMDPGGTLNTEGVMQPNDAWKARGANYDTNLVKGDKGFIPETVPFWKKNSPDEAQALIGKNWKKIFPNNKDARAFKKSGYDMSQLTADQLAAIELALGGKNPYLTIPKI